MCQRDCELHYESWTHASKLLAVLPARTICDWTWRRSVMRISAIIPFVAMLPVLMSWTLKAFLSRGMSQLWLSLAVSRNMLEDSKARPLVRRKYVASTLRMAGKELVLVKQLTSRTQCTYWQTSASPPDLTEPVRPSAFVVKLAQQG